MAESKVEDKQIVTRRKADIDVVDKRMVKREMADRHMVDKRVADRQVVDKRMADRRVDDQRQKRRKVSSSKSDSGSSTCSDWLDIKHTKQYKQYYTCKYCDKEFKLGRNLTVHMKNNCLKNPAAACNLPDMTRPYVCSVCGCCFGKRKALNYHEKHICQKSITCHICNMELSGSTTIARHIARCKEKMTGQRRVHKDKFETMFVPSQTISSSSDDNE